MCHRCTWYNEQQTGIEIWRVHLTCVCVCVYIVHIGSHYSVIESFIHEMHASYTAHLHGKMLAQMIFNDFRACNFQLNSGDISFRFHLRFYHRKSGFIVLDVTLMSWKTFNRKLIVENLIQIGMRMKIIKMNLTLKMGFCFCKLSRRIMSHRLSFGNENTTATHHRYTFVIICML